MLHCLISYYVLSCINGCLSLAGRKIVVFSYLIQIFIILSLSRNMIIVMFACRLLHTDKHC